MSEEIKSKSKRGGYRPGAGRKPGSRNVATASEKRSVGELAQRYAPDAIETLNRIMTHGQSEAARVSAATQLLDRAIGKPHQRAEVVAEVTEKPYVLVDVETRSKNDEARRLFHLMRKLAKNIEEQRLAERRAALSYQDQ